MVTQNKLLKKRIFVEGKRTLFVLFILTRAGKESAFGRQYYVEVSRMTIRGGLLKVFACVVANFKLKNVCITNGEMDGPAKGIPRHCVYTCFIIMKIKKMM